MEQPRFPIFHSGPEARQVHEQGSGEATVRCPKCQFDHPLQTTECLKCGIVFSKYKPPIDVSATAEVAGAAKQPDATVPANPADGRMARAAVWSFAASLDKALSPDADQSPAATQKQATREFRYRLLALPLALLLAYWLTATGFNMVAGMLAMVVHECGHAVTAWLAGRWAIPTFWFTMIGQSRSWIMVVLVTGGILLGAFQAWRARRWGWVCAAAAMLLLQMDVLSGQLFGQGPVIIFGGEGGAMVLASILMATFYAPRDSVLCKSWGLRWGLLVIGTLAFMHVYRAWSGPWENIPFGQIEGRGPSDPTLLTQMYGWSVFQLVDRYLGLAKACFMAMGAMYFWGLTSAYVATRIPAPQRAGKGLEAQGIR